MDNDKPSQDDVCFFQSGQQGGDASFMSFDSLHGVYLFAYPDEPLICNHIPVHQQSVCASADMALWLAVALPGSELPQRTTERIDGLRTGSFAGGFE